MLKQILIGTDATSTKSTSKNRVNAGTAAVATTKQPNSKPPQPNSAVSSQAKERHANGAL